MLCQFLTIFSTDNLELPALLFGPKNSTKVAIYLHGNGDSGIFYKDKLVNELAENLADKGISLLALNNRGARYRKKLIVHGTGVPGQEDTVIGGAHYELIEDCIKDIDGSIDNLEKLGYKGFYIIGFSTGANKICVYENLAKKNKVSKFVHAGPGDDSGLFYNEIGDKKFRLSMDYANKCLKSDNPLKVMPKYTGMNPFSAQSAYDILDPDGAYNTFPYFEVTNKRLGKKKLFKEYSAITKPMLVVFGENDEFTYTAGGTNQAINILEKHTNPKIKKQCEFKIIKNTDHSFNGAEKELAEMVAKFLA